MGTSRVPSPVVVVNRQGWFAGVLARVTLGGTCYVVYKNYSTKGV